MMMITTEPTPLPDALTATAGDEAPPGWVWPALALGLLMPPLTAGSRRDADLLRRLPRVPGERLARLRALPGIPAAVLTAVALTLALLFGFVRLGITDVYTESWLFLVLAVVLGLASPAAGLLLVLAFVPLDLLAAMTRGTLDPTLPALGGRAISWWLLWLLAVALPLLARQVPPAVLAATRPASLAARRSLAYAGGAATIAALLWLWSGAVVELIRPVYTWTSMLGDPRLAATGPVTDGRDGLLLAAAAAFVGWTLVRDLFRVLGDEVQASADPPVAEVRLPTLPVRLRPIRWLAAAAVGLLLLGAMISAPIDLVLLGGALLLSRAGVRRLLRRFPVALLLMGQVPWMARFAIGVGCTWLTSMVLTWLFPGPAFGSERFPIVIATSVAILVISLFLEVDGATDDLLRERDERAAARAAAVAPPTKPDSDGVAAAVVAGGLALIALIVPAVALAQGAPCPVGEICLPPASVSIAAAVGSAAMLALTMGHAGRFVSSRRDAAIRRPVGPSSRPRGASGWTDRARATVRGAWRAG